MQARIRHTGRWELDRKENRPVFVTDSGTVVAMSPFRQLLFALLGPELFWSAEGFRVLPVRKRLRPRPRGHAVSW